MKFKTTKAAWKTMQVDFDSKEKVKTYCKEPADELEVFFV